MAPSWRAATLSPFQSRIFLAIWTASLVSNVGSLIQAVGASWLMTSIAPSPDMVALVQASTALPILLLSLVAGAFADIWDRRNVMLIAQALMFSVSIALSIVTYLGLVTPWTLLSLTFLLGCGAAIYGPAWQSSVGEQVPREDIPAAVSLNSLAFNLARTAGPAIGGVIVAIAGPSTAFLVNAASYVGLIVVLVSWRRQVVPPILPPERLPTALSAGVRYTALSPAIRAVLMRGFLFGLMGSSLWALMPLIARDLLHGGALTYGLLFGSFGVGAVVGALNATALRQRVSSQAILTCASIAFGLATIGIAMSSWFAVTLPMLMVGGASWVLALSTLNITVQVSSPRWVVGRALAIYQMLTFGGLAIGSWLLGELAEARDLRTSLTVSGIAMVLSVMVGWGFKLPTTLGANLDPLRKSPVPPDMTAEVVPQSGPVVVAMEYRIAAQDRTAFMAAMREMRRIRRRDGARRWTLLQDIDDPERWIERFQSPTWLEYLRQRQRFTIADRDFALRARAFHRGGEQPKIVHMLERAPTSASNLKSVAERISERASMVDPNLPPAAMPENAGEAGSAANRV